MSDIATADEFDLFFEQESSRGLDEELEAGPKVEPEPEVKAEDPAPVETEAVATEPAPKVEEPVVEAPKVEEPAPKVEEPAPKVEPALKVVPKVEEPAPKVEEPEPPKVIDYTEDELKAIEEEQAEFPEVSKAWAARERVLTERFEQKLEIALAGVQKTLEPVFQNSQAQARNSYEAEILGKHADAFDQMDALSAWISEQPAIMQKAYNNILDTAVPASEVIELFDIFKAATKPAEPAVAEDAAPVVDEATKKKLASQEGVRSRRTDTKKDTGPLDFESAFNQA